MASNSEPLYLPDDPILLLNALGIRSSTDLVMRTRQCSEAEALQWLKEAAAMMGISEF